MTTVQKIEIEAKTQEINKTGFERNFAFIIGINNYKNGISTLKTAVNDAKKLEETLREKHGYHQVWVCLDETATLSNLNQFIEKTLPENVTKDDRLLFYFAGHGVALNGDDGPQGYLIPQDAKQGDTDSYLPMTKLHDALSNLKCRHFLGIFDCCFSGAFRWSSTRDLLTTPEVIHKERYDRFITDPAWQIITSSASDQKALDNFKLDTERGKVGEHSPFAAALLKALEGEADCYPPAKNGKPAGDGVITATELYLHLRDTVEIPTEECDLRQTPGIWCLNKHDKGEYIFLSPGHELNLPPAPPLDESKNPYRGLSSFDEEHSELFFGRSELVEELQGFVENHPLTIVLGASGSGKSSLVKAGLIPKLKQQAKETNEKWCVLSPIRPGEKPFQALNNALVDVNLPTVNLQNQQQNLSQSVAVWFKNNSNSKLLIFIDQSEELITLCQNENERKEFFQQILTAINAHRDKLRVVLTLRSDFEPQVRDAGLEFMPQAMNKLGNAELKNRWQKGRFIVPTMTRAELKEAIEKPAESRVMYFQPHDLVEELIDEVDDMPGALPLLSFALSELFLKYLRRQRDAQFNQGKTIERAITKADYEKLGGVMLSLTQRADEEYQKLVDKNPDYKQVIRHVMLRMVAIGGGELARRRVPLSELEYPPEKNALVKEVIEQFSQARLLVKGQDAQRNLYVEPAHDALVRAWEKLLAWKQKEEENLILQRRLTPAVADWQGAASQQEQASGFQRTAKPVINWFDSKFNVVENFFDKINPRIDEHFIRLWNGKQSESTGKQSQLLWNGSFYLDKLDDTLKSNDNWLNNAEAKFVRESVVRKQQNHKWRWRIAIAVMLGLSGLTIWALINLRNARIEGIKNLIQTSEVNLGANNQLDAIVEAIKAGQQLNNLNYFWLQENNLKHQVEFSLLQAMYSTQEFLRFSEVSGVTYSADGKYIASWNGLDGSVQLRNIEGSKLAVFQVNPQTFSKVMFSPDSKFLVTWNSENNKRMVQVWDMNGNRLAVVGKHQTGISKIEFSPDGKHFASGHVNGTAKIWNTKGQEIATLRGHKKHVWRLKFSPDGKFLVTGSTRGAARLWDMQGNLVAALGKDEDYRNVSEIEFSPDSKLVATSGSDGKLSIWDINGKELATMDQILYDMKFSPDGKRLATFIGNDKFRLWDVKGGNKLATIQGSAIDFSPDGKRLVTGSIRGTVWSWDINGKELDELQGHVQGVESVKFSPYGKTFATGSSDGTVRLWDLEGRELAVLQAHQQGVKKVDFVANRNLLVTWGEEDSTAKFWYLGGKESIAKDEVLAFSNSSYGREWLWNIKGKKLAPLRKRLKKSSTVKLSPDGKVIALRNSDNTVQLLSVEGQKLGELKVSEPLAPKMKFSLDSKILTTWTTKRMQLWDVNASNLITTVSRDLGIKQRIANRKLGFGGRQVIILSNGTVQLWKPEGNKMVLQQEKKGNFKNRESKNIELSPDGKLSAIFSENKLFVWNLKGKELVSLNQQQGKIDNVEFSSDNKHLAIQGERRIKIFAIKNGKKILDEYMPSGRKAYHNDTDYGIKFSPDGKHLANISGDNIWLWDIHSKKAVILRGRRFASKIKFQPNGKNLAVLSHYGIQLYNLDSGKISVISKGSSINFSPDGKWLAVQKSGKKNVYLLPIKDIEQMITKSCGWVRPYLNTKSKDHPDRHICDNIN